MREIGTESEMSLGRSNKGKQRDSFLSQTGTERITWRKSPFVNKVLVTCHWLLHCVICCLLSFSMAQY